MKTFFLLSLLASVPVAHAENDGGKLVSIQCLPALGKVAVKAVDSETADFSPQKIRELRAQGVYLGMDYGKEKGYTVDQTCALGATKVRLVVSYGNDFGNGYCGADPGASIEVYRNGEKLKAFPDQEGTSAEFDEDCRMGITSVTELSYDVQALFHGERKETLAVTYRTNAEGDKPDSYVTKTTPLN